MENNISPKYTNWIQPTDPSKQGRPLVFSRKCLISTVLVCNVALIIIAALGLSGTLSLNVATTTTMCVSIGQFIISCFGLSKGKKLQQMTIIALVTGLLCAITMTLGGMAYGGVLTINQMCLGILITQISPFALMVAAAVIGLGFLCYQGGKSGYNNHRSYSTPQVRNLQGIFHRTPFNPQVPS